MKVFIYACEQCYGGYHGINDYYVDEVDDDWTLDDVYREFVVEASYDIMNTYGDVMEQLCETAREFSESEEDFTDCLEELMAENVDGYVCKIKDDVDLSVEKLNIFASILGPELFVEQYCEENN